jgi:hypothetical protein
MDQMLDALSERGATTGSLRLRLGLEHGSLIPARRATQPRRAARDVTSAIRLPGRVGYLKTAVPGAFSVSRGAAAGAVAAPVPSSQQLLVQAENCEKAHDWG